MTTDAPAPRTSSPTSAAASSLAATVAGLAVLWVVTSTAVLYLDNLYGPFGEHGAPGVLAGLACGSAAGAAAFVLAGRVARRSRAMPAVVIGLVCLASWVLLPRQVDVSESWVPRPNPRWSCTGWSFQHYPPGMQDGSTTRYCVGLEKRLPDG